MTTRIVMHRPVFSQADVLDDDLGVTVRLADPDGEAEITLFLENWAAWEAIVGSVDAVRAGIAAGRIGAEAVADTYAADLAAARANEKASEPGLYMLDGRRYDVRLNRNTGRLNAFDASGVYAKGVIQRLYRAHKVDVADVNAPSEHRDIAITRRTHADEDDLLSMFDK